MKYAGRYAEHNFYHWVTDKGTSYAVAPKSHWPLKNWDNSFPDDGYSVIDLGTDRQVKDPDLRKQIILCAWPMVMRGWR